MFRMKRIYHIERQYDTSYLQKFKKSLTFCARICEQGHRHFL